MATGGRAIESRKGEPPLLGSDPKFTRLLGYARTVAQFDDRVLITGPNGAGKDGIAQLIHQNSPRSGNTIEVLNCACLPEHIAESMLFGHKRGAFTGALTTEQGAFGRAHW